MTDFEPRSALGTLQREGVRFVVIGGLAANLRGSPTVTMDVDICYARDPANLGALAQALNDLGARLRGVTDDVPFVLDAATLAAGDHFTFNTVAGALDCIGTPSGTSGFEDLDANADTMEFTNLTVRVASLDDLIRMKRASGRPKDRIELEVLGALRDELGDTTD